MGRRRVVLWLRVILPLAALAILSTLFLLSRRAEPDAAIPYVQDDGEAEARAPGITGPRFSTVTADGAVVTFRAGRFNPGQGGGTARQPVLAWRTRDGLRTTLSAGTGQQDGGHIVLGGGVDMALSSGWTLRAPQVEADTAASRLTAPGPVAVTAPFGRLDAGGMVLEADAGAGQVLELNRGVRLIYRPLSAGAAPPSAPQTESR